VTIATVVERSERRMAGVVEAARYAGVSEATFWRLLAEGALPSIKVRRRRLLDLADVDAWLDRLREADGALGVPA
jgi:excisionase family DNA binding protein